MLVRRRVDDYAEWKRVVDAHAAARQESGLRVQEVIRNVDEPHEVFLLFEVSDLEWARASVTLPDVPQAQQQSGIVDDPDICFLD